MSAYMNHRGNSSICSLLQEAYAVSDSVKNSHGRSEKGERQGGKAPAWGIERKGTTEANAATAYAKARAGTALWGEG